MSKAPQALRRAHLIAPSTSGKEYVFENVFRFRRRRALAAAVALSLLAAGPSPVFSSEEPASNGPQDSPAASSPAQGNLTVWVKTKYQPAPPSPNTPAQDPVSATRAWLVKNFGPNAADNSTQALAQSMPDDPWQNGYLYTFFSVHLQAQLQSPADIQKLKDERNELIGIWGKGFAEIIGIPGANQSSNETSMTTDSKEPVKPPTKIHIKPLTETAARSIIEASFDDNARSILQKNLSGDQQSVISAQTKTVIPAKAGIQKIAGNLDPGLRRGDVKNSHRALFPHPANIAERYAALPSPPPPPTSLARNSVAPINRYTDDASQAFKDNYRPDGRPRVTFTRSLQRRFGNRLNHAVNPATMTPEERAQWQTAWTTKWQPIYREILRVANLNNPERGYLLFANIKAKDREQAEYYATLFEKHGIVQQAGAYRIATNGTAELHGFARAPCAELESEIIREAYKRAGHDSREDFNEGRGNPLIWLNTSSVHNLSVALDRAGWVPWDAAVYKPLRGSIMINADGGPGEGHAYLAAEDGAIIIVDNGSPNGGSLRGMKRKYLEDGYQNGLFFLPPGVTPSPWPSSQAVAIR